MQVDKNEKLNILMKYFHHLLFLIKVKCRKWIAVTTKSEDEDYIVLLHS